MARDAPMLPARYADPELIARGGMADIYAARDTELARQVAIKVLSERFAQDPDIRERFKREALAAARLSGHPNIATIFDVGESGGRPFIVMELLDGGTLADRIEAAAVPREQALAWLGQAASALDAAHAEDIVHRDVKPGNMLLDANGELKVTDFGIALVLDEAATAATATGTILGTAGYLSPEQAAGLRATAESDVYSLGVVAYELLAGQRPFARGNAAAEAAAHLHEPARPPSEVSGLPSQVDPVFARVLAKDPAYRYPAASDFVEDLGAGLAGRDVPAGPAVAMAAGAGAAAGATEVTQVARRARWPARRGVPLAAAILLLAGGALSAVLLSHTQTPASGGSPVTSQQRSTHKLQSSTTAPVVNPVAPPPHGKGKDKGHKKPKAHDKPKGHHQTSTGIAVSPPTTVQGTTAPTTTSATTTTATTTTSTTTGTTTTTPGTTATVPLP